IPSEQIEGEVPETVYMLKPEQIAVNFGADNYTVVPSGTIWYNESDKDSFVKELGRFGPAENILVKEITYAQYQEVKKYQSIWADFNYNIPISDFCSNFKMQKPQSYDVIQTVTAIGYSAAEGGKSLFIYDGRNHKYYRLVADTNKGESETNHKDNTDFPALIASIQAGGYNIYYPISSYTGVGNNTNTLVPFSVETNLRGFSFRQDTYSYQTEKISAMAEKFFGGNLDFTRRIVEDKGTIIYMYGYGQNVLIVNTDGSIEYKEEQIGNTEQSFSEALDTAVNYVASHGSWQSLDGAKLTPYLKDVIPDPDKEKGYRFIFGMEINGSRLFYEAGDPIVVDVTSGQVTYYKRNIIDFDQGDIEAIDTFSTKDAFSAVNLIAQNCKYMYDILLQAGAVKATADQDAMLEDISSLVNSMQIGYVKQADEEITEIQPAWIVSVNDTDIYFDLYSADPIGYSKE
ncbi:MAG TPA: hypothetical protein VM577_10595, partial [Anaerovoracaceae bacterium]|nr:hypothetical protein [Anaerovoracaceae bacterium]